MIDRRSGDVLTSVVDDVDTLQDLYLRVLVPPLAGALAIGLGCVVLGTFDPWLGLVLLAYLLVAGVALPLATRRLGRRPAGALVDTQGEMGGVIVEGLTGIGELVAYGRTDLLVDRLDALTARQAADRRELAVARGLAASLTVARCWGCRRSACSSSASPWSATGRSTPCCWRCCPSSPSPPSRRWGRSRPPTSTSTAAAPPRPDWSRSSTPPRSWSTLPPDQRVAVDPRSPVDLEVDGVSFGYEPGTAGDP